MGTSKKQQKAMPRIKIRRYNSELQDHWLGWIEPEDKSWILFIDAEEKPVFFGKRDPETGAVITDGEIGINVPLE